MVSGLKPSLYACTASTVPASLSIAPAQPFFLLFNLCFPQYPGVPKPSSGHMCIKCIQLMSWPKTCTDRGQGTHNPDLSTGYSAHRDSFPLHWERTCPSHCGTEQHPGLPNAERPPPTLAVPSSDHAKPPQLETASHRMPRDDCMRGHMMTAWETT